MSLFDKPTPKYHTVPFAKAGETYGGARLRVFNRDTGDEIHDVEEANAREGWLIKICRGPDGQLRVDANGDIVRQRVKGYFEIRLYRSDNP